MIIVVRYDSGSEGKFGPFDNINVATQVLALIAGKPNVISATIEKPLVVSA